VSDLFPIRDFIAANSDNASELRARWQTESSPPKKEKPMQTAAKTYLETRVAEKLGELETQRIEGERAEALRKANALKSANDTVRLAFKDLLNRDAASVSDGRLHFTYRGKDYSAFVREGAWYLVDGEREIKFAGSGPATENLIETLAKESR
jgi:hypothetical protein